MRRPFLLSVLAVPVIAGAGFLAFSAISQARLPDAASVTGTASKAVQKKGQYSFFEDGVPPLLIPTDLYDDGSKTHNAMGIYLTPNTMANEPQWNEYLDALMKAGGNAFVVAVKGGQVFFPSDSPLGNKFGLVHPTGDLKKVVAEAKARGIYTIARYISLKDPNLAAAAPFTQVKDPRTGVGLGEMWVDGANETVLQYNREVIKDLLTTGIEEINLDYIRFPTEYPGILNALDTEGKVAHVEPFVRMVRETIDQYAPSTKLGLSTYAILGWNYPINLHALGQDVVKFAPMIDVISPMAYPSTFTSPEYYVEGKHPGPRDYWLVYRTLDGYKKLLGEEEGLKKLRPWIQGYFVDQEDVLAQIRAVHDAGLCGFTVWNASNNYDVTFKAMSRMPKAPERCLQ